MIETMKQISCEAIEKWEKLGEVDMVKELANLMMRNILACVFGRANENPFIKRKVNGVIEEI